MTASTIDHRHRQTIRKRAAVVAALLVLGVAAVATASAWNDPTDQAGLGSNAAMAISAGHAPVGDTGATIRVS